jgi:hypothetical protein
MPPFKNRKGEIYKSCNGESVEILEYTSSKNSTVKFEDGTILYNVQFTRLLNSNIENPNFPFLYGIGYKGIGKYKIFSNNKINRIYFLWHSMFKRCYSGEFETYKGVTVCEEWYNYQVFAEWVEKNWKDYMNKTWDLDKDIICPKCKIYSPETCTFVPHEINILYSKLNTYSNKGKYLKGVYITPFNRFQAQIYKNKKLCYLGSYDTELEAFQAYKTAKEQHIKEVADKWKDLINLKVYENMYNYQIEIID